MTPASLVASFSSEKHRERLSYFLSSFLFPLLLIGFGYLAYANTLAVPFLFDDVLTIEGNRALPHFWSIPAQGGLTTSGRPLVSLFLAWNDVHNGHAVRGYHLFNLGVHLAAGCALFGVLRRTLQSAPLASGFGKVAAPLAFLTALLWLLHPLQTESVTYIVQRTESMMGLCYLFSLYALIRYATAEPIPNLNSNLNPNPTPISTSQPTPSLRGRFWAGIGIFSCFAGMACKEVMLSVPLLLFLYDRTFLSGTFRAAWRQRSFFYGALATSWIWLGYLVFSTRNRGGTAGFIRPGAGWYYVLTQIQAIPHYLRLAFWPHPLVFDYGTGMVDRFTQVWPQALILCVLLTATGIALWRWPLWGFLGAWFFAILAPSSSVVPVLTQTMAEHRMYLPVAAPIVLVSWGLFRWFEKKSYPILIGLALLCGVLTFYRNHNYRTALAIWEDTAAKVPQNPRAHNNFSTELIAAGRPIEARREVDATLLIDPHYAEAHINLSVLFLNAGQIPQSMAEAEKALQLSPESPEANNNLAIGYLHQGQWQPAIVHFQKTLKKIPGNAQVHSNLGVAYLAVGENAAAEQEFATAARLNPENMAAHRNLGRLLLARGQTSAALLHLEAAKKISQTDAFLAYSASRVPAPDLESIHPDPAAAALEHGNLAVAWFSAGKNEEAVEEFTQALQWDPRSASIHNNFGVLLAKTGHPEEALHHFEQAVQIQPNFAEAQNNLGLSLVTLGRREEARAHYETALRIEPNYGAARANLARLSPSPSLAPSPATSLKSGRTKSAP